MAAVAGEGFWEIKRDRSPLHVLRFSVFVMAAAVPILGWCRITRSIALPGILFCIITLAFALLSVVELIRIHRREVFHATLAQWAVLLLLLAAWGLQATSRI